MKKSSDIFKVNSLFASPLQVKFKEFTQGKTMKTLGL